MEQTKILIVDDELHLLHVNQSRLNRPFKLMFHLLVIPRMFSLQIVTEKCVFSL